LRNRIEKEKERKRKKKGKREKYKESTTMKIDIKGILEGAYNSIMVSEQVEEVAKDRMAICKDCDQFSTNAKENSGYKTWRPEEHCINCGCALHMKTRCMACNCPLYKWGKITETNELDSTINQITKNGTT
jgi:hypothetical protein